MPLNRERLRKGRLDKIQRMMRRDGYDALILSYVDDVRYATDYPIQFHTDGLADRYAAVVAQTGDPMVLAPVASGGDPLEPVVKEFPVLAAGVIEARWWARSLKKALDQIGALKGKIGVDYLPYPIYYELKPLLERASITPIVKEVFEARMIKLADEVELMRRTCRIADDAMQTAIASLKPGMTQKELSALILHEIALHGVAAFPFMPYIISGTNFSNAIPTSRKIERGDVVHIDFACWSEDGYICDFGRSGVLGRATGKKKEMLEGLYEVMRTTGKAIKPGLKSSKLDDIVRSAAREVGYPHVHEAAIGHGIGMRTNELPWIAQAKVTTTDYTIAENMTINIEPLAAKEGVGSASIENVFLVNSGGNEILTKTDYEPFGLD